MVLANRSGVGVEAPSAAQVGQGKTQREIFFVAVEALRSLLVQGVHSQVEDLIQEHISPSQKVNPPHSPTELERAQHLAKLLEEKAKLEKSIQGREEKVSNAKLAVSQAEDDLSILQQEMRRLSFQIDAHHREDDAGGRRIKVGEMIWKVSLWRKLVVGRRLGSRLMGVRGGGLARVGGGSSSSRVGGPSHLQFSKIFLWSCLF